MLRSERSGTGNGRVYQVSFTADDEHGGSCTGAVTMCVPHDRRQGICVNDGQQYNATWLSGRRGTTCYWSGPAPLVFGDTASV